MYHGDDPDERENLVLPRGPNGYCPVYTADMALE